MHRMSVSSPNDINNNCDSIIFGAIPKFVGLNGCSQLLLLTKCIHNLYIHNYNKCINL